MFSAMLSKHLLRSGTIGGRVEGEHAGLRVDRDGVVLWQLEHVRNAHLGAHVLCVRDRQGAAVLEHRLHQPDEVQASLAELDLSRIHSDLDQVLHPHYARLLLHVDEGAHHVARWLARRQLELVRQLGQADRARACAGVELGAQLALVGRGEGAQLVEVDVRLCRGEVVQPHISVPVRVRPHRVDRVRIAKHDEAVAGGAIANEVLHRLHREADRRGLRLGLDLEDDGWLPVGCVWMPRPVARRCTCEVVDHLILAKRSA